MKQSELNDIVIEHLKEVYYKKIQLADAIYVVDINGKYTGEQVKKERKTYL